MHKLSAIIITYNEEKNIRRCLHSLAGVADEIIIVDSFSTDATEAICKEYSVRFIKHVWEGFSSSKNFANQQASHDYILSIDADEALSEELKTAIIQEKEKGLSGAYGMNRLTEYGHQWIKHSGWYPDRKIRIWNRNEGAWQGTIHEKIVFRDPVEITRLKGDLLHYSYRNIADHLERANNYTSLIAENYYRQGKRATFAKLYFASKFCFFKDFFLRQGWRDGWQGLTICRIAAHSTYLKYAKLKELQESRPTTTLIVTTYNRPDALELVLLSILKQSKMPDEIIIADDGSTNETKELIALYRKKFQVPFIHCWQEDEGFRLSRIRNKAIAQSSGEYVIMMDGDMVLHPDFVKDHTQHALPNHFIQGSRVLVSKEATISHLNNRDTTFSPYSSGIINRLNACRSRFLSKCISKNYGKKDYQGVRGCNMSFWKNDLIRINGFNEDFVGWGREDSEFVVRLLNNGTTRKNVKFAAVAFHLWHAENKHGSAELEKNEAFLQKTIHDKKNRCDNGLDQYLLS